LLTAFARTTATHLFFVGCDMPFVSPVLVKYQLELAITHTEADVVVLRSGERLEPMHSVYVRSALATLENCFGQGERSVNRCLMGLRTSIVEDEMVGELDPTGLSTFNANTPDEWNRALLLASRESTLPDIPS
jgi:molybdenum cofactor guanylyltransferase